MTTKRPQLAKLTRPRLHKAVARERLFEMLDEKREYPVVWIVGPPGAGKTTLAASYLEEAGAPAIWYQIDPGDSDPATFFFYLKQAIEAVGKKKAKPLPLLTPEYLPDLPGFARRFLRDGFAQLPEDVILVFDNYHDIADDSSLHAPFKAALAEVSPGSNIIVLSRNDPPASFAGALVNQIIATVTGEELRLTQEETTAIAASRGITDSTLLRTLHEQSTGWMAGVTLMLDRVRGGASLEALGQPEAMDTVFNYFATLIFDQVTEETQEVLMKTAFLPRVTATLAEAVTSKSNAIEHIEELYRRHLFTDRRETPERIYQFHALFLAFLRHCAQQVLSADEQAKAALAAAEVLQTDGDTEAAFYLYVRAGHAKRATELLIRDAEQLLSQGRWQTLVHRISALPAEVVQNNAWLLYWLGTAKTAIDPKEARLFLESSHGLAVRNDDPSCQIQTIAGVIQTYMLEYNNFRPLDPWIDALKKALLAGHPFPSPDSELRVLSALLAALSFRSPGDSMLEPCAERVFDLVGGSADATLRTLSAAFLAYCARTGPVSVALRAQPLLQKLILQPGLSALTIGWGWWAIAYVHLVSGNAQACRHAVAEADRIGRDEALAPVSRFAAAIGAHIEMDQGNLPAAQSWSIRLDAVIVPGLPYDRALSNTIKAFLASMQGDPSLACALAQEALALFDKVGVHQLRCLTRTQLAWPLMMQKEFSAAEHVAQEALALALAARAEWVELEARFVLAAIAMEQQDEEILGSRLQSAFALLQKTRYVPTLSKYKGWAAKLCGAALQRNIETGSVQSLVRQLKLRAPSQAIEKWPWQVRVYTLGRFLIEINDAPMKFSRKTPKKLVLLIKALIAFGGENVHMEKLVDTLWPDEDGDSAHDACWLAINRLRNLLGGPHSVLLTGGRVSLNRDLVWTDLRLFEHVSSTTTGESLATTDITQTLAIYRGCFLPEEPDALWTTPARERTRAKFTRLVAQCGQELERSVDPSGAIALYWRGLDADPLAEPFYQGLMRCYQSQGRTAEALNVYHQLSQMLSATLGIRPSATTEALIGSLRTLQ